MRRLVIVSALLCSLAACGGSDDEVATEPADAAIEATEAAAGDDPPAPTEPPAADADADNGGDPGDDGSAVPGPGDAVGTLTGPDLDIAVVGRCNYDVSDLTSADIAFAEVRGVDPTGIEIPTRFSLSGSRERNTQLNINGTQVVVRWPEPGLLEQATDEGSYVLETTIGRLVVTTADGYELNISCFER